MKGKGNPNVLAAARAGRACGGSVKASNGGHPPVQSAAGKANGANSHGPTVGAPISKASKGVGGRKAR